ncbi:hypothetical protein D3C72_1373870 [compost metagenome]
MVETLRNHGFAGIIEVVDIGAIALPFRPQTLVNIFEYRLRADIGAGIRKPRRFGPLGIWRQRCQQVAAILFGTAALIGGAYNFKIRRHDLSPVASAGYSGHTPQTQVYTKRR